MAITSSVLGEMTIFVEPHRRFLQSRVVEEQLPTLITFMDDSLLQ